ncbi:MAG: hypothetical protein R2795_03360 [Saprospiraceae bacterium]
MQRFLFVLAMVGVLAACDTTKQVAQVPVVEVEERLLDTLYVTAPEITQEEEFYALPAYNPSAQQDNDLLHTRLEIAFDWDKEQVIGTAQLDVRPYFYPVNQLTLDAKSFTFSQVTLGDGTPLQYTYDGKQINIQLPRYYNREETYQVKLSYVATPRADGGSDAITSDKGLFFINPRGEEGDKPRQIWTQGETENNSRWFPTIDKPNERCTQEVYVTVPANYATLSNGIKQSFQYNADDTRTDYWLMDDPHAPYLFMLAIGDFAVVEDAPWNNKPVNYYVEPEFATHAKAIFPHTPEMLTFFSNITGVPYPWDKYSQIVVRDYVSGPWKTQRVLFSGSLCSVQKGN